MVVESADRFGLSQLHQLEREGRLEGGQKQPYYVFSLLGGSERREEARRRLSGIVSTTDGFKIAGRGSEAEVRGSSLQVAKQRGVTDFRAARYLGTLNFFCHLQGVKPSLSWKGASIFSDYPPA